MSVIILLGTNKPSGGGGGGSVAPPLDTVSAYFAYSVRKLKTGQINAMRVRRASDNNTLDIGFSSNDLDTASLASFCSGTNGYVIRLYDQSGNLRNIEQITDSRQPQIVANGSVLTGSNGRPCWRCDGVDDYFDLPNLSAATNGEVFSVLKGNSSNVGHWYFGNNSVGGWYSYFGTVYENFGVDGARYSFNPVSDVGLWRLYNCEAAANLHKARIDTVERFSSTTLLCAFSTTPLLGRYDPTSANYSTQDMSELIFKDSVYLPGDRAFLEGNIDGYFALGY